MKLTKTIVSILKLKNILSHDFTISIVLSGIFLFLFGFSINPCFSYTGIDESIFQAMGLGMVNGKIPFVELFDHKGVVLFSIEALGWLVYRGHVGIFILSVLFFGYTLFLWKKTAELFVSGFFAWLPSILTLQIYVLTIEGANDSEFWSLPFISLPIYYLAESVVRRCSLSSTRCMVIGMACAVILFIRANNAAPVVAVCLCFFVWYLIRHKYRELLKKALFVFMGFVLFTAVVTFLFGFIYGFEYIYDLYFGTLFFNFEYTANHIKGSLICIPFVLSIVFSIIAIILTFNKYILLNIFVLLGFVITYATMGTARYMHYFTVSLPIYIVAFVLIFSSEQFSKYRNKYLFVVLLAFVTLWVTKIYPSVTPRIRRVAEYEPVMEKVREDMAKIPEKERDSIWNYNAENFACLFLMEVNSVQMNRVILTKHVQYCGELKDVGTIQEKEPLWIILRTRRGEEPASMVESHKDSLYISQKYDEKYRFQLTSFNSNTDVVMVKRINVGR